MSCASCSARRRRLRRPGPDQLRGRARDRNADACQLRPRRARPTTSPSAPAPAGRSPSSRPPGRSRCCAAATTSPAEDIHALARTPSAIASSSRYQALAEETDAERSSTRCSPPCPCPRSTWPDERRVSTAPRCAAGEADAPGPGPMPRAAPAGARHSRSAGGSRAARRRLPLGAPRRGHASSRRCALRPRATTCARSSGTSPPVPASRTSASTSPSACSSPGSCSTRRRR